MKQTQSGVSMVSLVITIIVIIILAAVAFSGSQETIGRAGFSGYTTDIDSVRTAFLTEGVTNLIGSEAAKNNTVTEAQAYNYLAKGATTNRLADTEKTHAWLSKAQANAIPATRIEKTYAKEAIGIELPKRTVNTYGATGVEIEYFVTNDGIIFTWPPYLRSDDGLFYVNDTVTVRTPAEDMSLTAGTETKVFNNTIISGDDEKFMYADGFEFKISDVVIKVASGDNLLPLKADVTTGELEDMASVIYLDKRNPDVPKGVETEKIYQDTKIISFTICGYPYEAEEGMTWGEWAGSKYYKEEIIVGTDRMYYENTDIQNMLSGKNSGWTFLATEIIDGEEYITYMEITGRQ